MKANRLPNMLAFNGSSDFMTLPIVPSVTGFNLAFWMIKRNSTNNARIFDCQDAGPEGGFTVVEITNGNNQFVTRNGASATGSLTSVRNVNADLVHYVYTHDGTTSKLYENGVLIATDTSSVMSAPSLTALYVARRAPSSSNFWNGKLGEVVFQNTATPWTQAQITELYYSGSIPSGASYWLFDGNVLDGSGNGNHGTLTGGTYIYQGVPRVVSRDMGGSTLFNGSNARISIPYSANIDLPNQFSFSFWTKINTIEAANSRLIRNDINGWQFYLGGENLLVFNYGGNYQTVGTIVPGKWFHVSVTYDGSFFRIYIDGNYRTVSTVAGPLTSSPAGVIYLATEVSYNYVACNLAEVKIFNSALTASQAQELYSTGSVSGVSPVANYALDDQPSTYIDSIAGNNGTGTATTYSSDTPVKQRTVVSNDTASLYFAAIGDVINYGNLGGTVGDTWSTVILEKMKTGSYGITLEARVWNKGTDHIRTTSTGAPAGSINGTAFNGASGFFLFDNKWHEYGFTYDGANVKCYRDGLLNQSVAFVATATDTASDFSAGNRTANSRALDGWLKSFRHYRNRVLTTDEIRGLYFSRTEPSTTGLLINSQLNEGAGTTAYDSSGNGNNGTITGATWSSDTPSKARTTASARTSV